MSSRFSSNLGCFFVAVLFAAVVLTGCTAAKKSPPAAAKSSEPYRVEDEGKVPPLPAADVRKEVDREEKYEDLPVNEEPVRVETVEPAPLPAPDSSSVGKPAAGGPKTMTGYRVQVFASASEDAARSVKEAAEVRLASPVYVELIDGVYKVRVGDCPTREEADVLLKKCRDAGYGDAWVASGTIFMPVKKAGP